MKKSIALVLAAVLLIVATVGGTLAWLTATSDTVTNTFTTSDIKVKLEETTGTEYKMIPGYELAKNPKATVETGSEPCWLFVKIDVTNNTYGSGDSAVNYLTYEVDTSEGQWTKLTGEGVTGEVYYRKVETANIGTAYSVLKGDKVTVNGAVTKEMMTAAETSKPTLTFTAYASQLYKNSNTTDNEFTALEAWNNITTK